MRPCRSYRTGPMIVYTVPARLPGKGGNALLKDKLPKGDK